MTDTNLTELRKELSTLRKNLSVKANEYKTLCEDYPAKEHLYRTALAVEMLRLRAEAYPVTLIPNLAKGEKNVSKLRWDRDVAKAVKDACRSTQTSIEISINTIQTEINSELREHELAGKWQA